MGAWHYIFFVMRIAMANSKARVTEPNYVGRPPAASPATGSLFFFLFFLSSRRTICLFLLYLSFFFFEFLTLVHKGNYNIHVAEQKALIHKALDA